MDKRKPISKRLHFDIDKYLNRIIPPSQVHRLPWPVSRFLGYRKEPQEEVGNILVCWWAFIGAVGAICLVAGVFKYSATLQTYHPPLIVASFGATAVLEYGTIQSPLAQPRNSILGHGLSAIIGVCIAKLFMLSDNFEEIQWVAGAICCGVASALMTITNTVHPPGGATALLAAVDPTVRAMGWHFIPLILVGALLMLATGLLLNNIQRQFPAYWWTPRDLERKKVPDIEELPDDPETWLERKYSMPSDPRYRHAIIITPDHVEIPEQFTLGPEQSEVLRILKEKLRHELPRDRSISRTRSRNTDRRMSLAHARSVENADRSKESSETEASATDHISLPLEKEGV